MKAVILCGGIGSRLRPLTETTPKPLIRLLNVPVLKLIIDKVIASGIKDISLSLGFKAMDIIAYCEKAGFAENISYFEEETPLGTAGGVKNCVPGTSEDLLVLSGDNVFNIDLKKVLSFHRQTDADVTIVGKEVEDPREYGSVLCGADGRVLRFLEKPTWETAESYLINTGIYILKGKIMDQIPAHTKYDFADGLFQEMLRNNQKLMCCITEDFWGDIGELDAYTALSAEMLKSFTDDFVYSGKLYTKDHTDENGNSFLAPCLIDRGCVFGKNNTVGPNTVLGKDVQLVDSCTVRGSILGNGVTVESNSDVIEVVTDDAVHIAANCLIEKHAVLGYGVTVGRFSRVLERCKIWPGRTVFPESVVSGELFFESPERIEPNLYGVSGKSFSQFSLSDAVRIGQAFASVKDIKKIGFGSDGSNTADLYKSACIIGARSCGVICYDFEAVYTAQAYYYCAYCELDSYLFVSSEDGIVRIVFFGKYGFPLSAVDVRHINNNYRFSTFHYRNDTAIPDIYNMHLLNAAYLNDLQKLLPHITKHGTVRIECENPLLQNLLKNFFTKFGIRDGSDGIQFLINYTGTELYCVENERFYSSDRIRCVLSEIAFAQSEDVLLGEEMPDFIFDKSVAYNANAYRMNAQSQSIPHARDILLKNIWNFDAVFLCVKTLALLNEANICMEQLMSLQQEFAVRKKVIELNCAPSEIRKMIRRMGAVKKKNDPDYFSLPVKSGEAKLRQLGNTSRLKLMVQATDSETAKEIGVETIAKIQSAIIDIEDEKL